MFNKNWISWFIGFIDAEGNFQMFPKKRVRSSGEIARYNVGYSFHLSLHDRDSSIINDIQKKLGVGLIYKYRNRHDCRLAVNKKSDILYLIDNIFDKYSLVTKNQLIRYNLLKNGIINDIVEFKTLKEYQDYKTNSLSSITDQVNRGNDNKYNNISIDNWIIGFINGEGCFYLNRNRCNFYIEHTDKQALELIKIRLDFGPNVLERSRRLRDIGRRKTTYQLIISSKKDLKSLVMLLDNSDNIPLQGNKYIQYVNWKQHLNI